MTDKQMYKELKKFANDHTLAKNNIKVTVFDSYIRYESINDTARYEDVILLREIIRGAEHYLMWKRRGK